MSAVTELTANEQKHVRTALLLFRRRFGRWKIVAKILHYKADTIEALVAQLDGMKREACLATIDAFNAAVRTDIPYDPGKKDGLEPPLASVSALMRLRRGASVFRLCCRFWCEGFFHLSHFENTNWCG